MPKGTQLSEFERGQIVGMKQAGYTGGQIAAAIGRSKTVVNGFLKDPTAYATAKHTGRPASLTKRQKYQTVALARDEKLFSSEIVARLDLPCTSRTVRRVLAASSLLRFGKLSSRPPLTAAHKAARISFAREYVTFGEKWDDVVFSDEKKFMLDGPDGFRRYWHHIRDKTIFSKRQFGGGTVMVWGAFASRGVLPLVIISTRMNSSTYQDMLAAHLLPAAPLCTSGDWLFQQDNAPCHRSASTKDWFIANNVTVLDWPARSPDLNPVENVWGLLSRYVYDNGHRQFSTTQELTNAIKSSWENIDTDVLKKLSRSMTDRLLQVVTTKGALIDF